MAQRVKLPPGTPTSRSTQCQAQVKPLFPTQLPRRMAQGLGFLPLKWGTQLLAPDFDLARLWLLQALAQLLADLTGRNWTFQVQQTSGWNTDLSLCAFQIIKNKLLKTFILFEKQSYTERRKVRKAKLERERMNKL